MLAGAVPSSAGIYPGFIERLITDSARVLQTPPLERPLYLRSFTDPVFGTRITRITNDTGSPMSSPLGLGTWGEDRKSVV